MKAIKLLIAMMLIAYIGVQAQPNTTPPAVTGTLVLDADPVSGFTPTLWTDKSGAGHNLSINTVASGTHTPASTTGHGLAAVNFGGNSTMQYVGATDFDTSATIFVVSDNGNYAGGTNAPISIVDTGSTLSLNNEFTIEANNAYHHTKPSNWVGKGHPCESAVPSGQIIVQTGAWHSGVANTDLDFFLDGNKSTQTATTLNSPSAYTNAIRTINVGARISGTAIFFDGFNNNIYRILVYNTRLSDADIATINNYLMNQYGIVPTACVSDSGSCPTTCYWSTEGNPITGVNNILGTTSNNDMRIISNSAERMRIKAAGNIGIGNTNPLSPLDVYKPSSGSLSTSYAVNVLNADVVTSSGTAYGVYGTANGTNSGTNTTNSGGGFAGTGAIINTGVQGVGTGGTVTYGGYFTSQGASLANVGVYGATTNVSGADNFGVYGSVPSGTHPSNCAGYFNGDVYTSAGNFITSDEKLKTNVQDFKNSLDMLKKLQPKTYDFRVADYKDYMNLQDGNQVGIMAQNLQAVFPNLVKEKETPALTDPATHEVINKSMKFLAVNYVGLVPVLVQAVNELNAKTEENAKLQAALDNTNAALANTNATVATLQKQLNDICNGGCAAFKATGSDQSNLLMQNVPNPFSQQTSIGYVLNVGTSAYMNINSLDGKVVKHIDLAVKGAGAVTIGANEMAPGTYTYTLVVDTKVVDTKIMVITAQD